MDADSLYWTLSTFPQVSAALVAFIGFLALSSVEESRKRRAQIEKQLKEMLPHIVKDVSWLEIEVWSSKQLMERINYILSNPEQTGARQLPQLREFRDLWSSADRQVRFIERPLICFVLLHLTVILASLGALPYVPLLIGLPYLRKVAILVAVAICATTVHILFVTLLWQPRYGTRREPGQPSAPSQD